MTIPPAYGANPTPSSNPVVEFVVMGDMSIGCGGTTVADIDLLYRITGLLVEKAQAGRLMTYGNLSRELEVR